MWGENIEKESDVNDTYLHSNFYIISNSHNYVYYVKSTYQASFAQVNLKPKGSFSLQNNESELQGGPFAYVKI